MFISCHIPKTAGASFGTALSEAFGERFLWDTSCATVIAELNADPRVPVESVPSEWLVRYQRPALERIACVHGHFPLRKYITLAFDFRNVFMVWLRDPLQRQISQYYYWKQLYPHPTEKFLNQVFDEEWDIERFCLDPAFHNYQSRFLAWFPWHRINFVGVTENYAADLDYLSRYVLRRELTLHKINESRKPAGALDGCFGSSFRRRFESNNRVDYRYYRKARLASDMRAENRAKNKVRDCG